MMHREARKPSAAEPAARDGARSKVAASEQLRRVARGRAAVFERVVSSLTHALGTPLQVIAGRAAMIRMDAVDDELREHAKIIEKKVHDMTQLLQRVLEFVRGNDFDPAEADFRLAMTEAIAGIEPLAAERGVRLELRSEVPARCAAAYETLLLLATDLLADAVESSSAGDTIRVTLEPGQPAPPSFAGADHDGVVAKVEGAGLDAAMFERAHEPWMKPSPGNRDVALRRAVISGLLRRVGGCLDVQEGPAGLSVVVWIPSSVAP